jgi:hypothetical protein
MSERNVTVKWKRETPDFSYQTYNRDHRDIAAEDSI